MSASVTRRQAIFFLILTAILWSSSGLLVKIISWQPLSILSGRSILSTLVFWIYLQCPVQPRWTGLQVVGAVGYVGAQLFFHHGHQTDNCRQCHLSAVHASDLYRSFRILVFKRTPPAVRLDNIGCDIHRTFSLFWR